MEVVVDLSTGSIALRDRDELGTFAVRAVAQEPDDGVGNGALGALAAALSVHEAGTVRPDGDVVIPLTVVQKLAEEAAMAEGQTLDAEWQSGFTTMVDHAATKGWIAEDGSIQAHVEWSY